MIKALLYISFLVIFFQEVIAQSDSHLLPNSNAENIEVIKHTYYSLEYNELHEQASWVYYKLTTEFITGPGERKNKFKPDYLIDTESAQLIDYKGKYQIIKIPVVSEFIYGRSVGYKINKYKIGKDLEKISATKIRRELKIG